MTGSIRNGIAVVSAVVVLGLAPAVFAQSTAVDPAATEILKRMTDYLGGLQRFSMHTENMYEDVLESGQKIQNDFSSEIVVQRPNKLRADRTGGPSNQLFIYDGTTLTMFDSDQNVYATTAAPDNLDDALHFASDTLDLVPPAGDMIFSDAFDLLTAGITSGIVVGKAVVGGVDCDHLAFTTPIVDWQVWIAGGEAPFPLKYVLTTRDDPAQPQYIVLISDWKIEPDLAKGLFSFSPPPSAKEIEFHRADAGSTATH